MRQHHDYFILAMLLGAHSFTIYDARLGSSGSAAYQGRVELLTSHGWLPLCDDIYNWYSSESRVLCQQLGYNYFTYSEK